LSFTYDRYGNRTIQSVTAGNAPSNSVVVSATTNRITTSGYSYDASGNMTNDGQNTLTYDGENRTITSSGSLGSGTYTYDGYGLRVTKVSGGTTTVSIYSRGNVIAEYQNGAAPTSPTNEYIYSGGQMIASVQSGLTYYFHNDHLSHRMRTNSAGAIQDQRATYPFGETWYATVAGEWMFGNYERDAESGNDYAWARYDVNRLGRFSSPDPIRGTISDPQSLNRYAYVSNDPINHSDPSGLCKSGLLAVGNKILCSSARPLNAPPDGSGGWLGGEYNPFSSPFADPNSSIYSQQQSTPDSTQQSSTNNNDNPATMDIPLTNRNDAAQLDGSQQVDASAPTGMSALPCNGAPDCMNTGSTDLIFCSTPQYCSAGQPHVDLSLVGTLIYNTDINIAKMTGIGAAGDLLVAGCVALGPGCKTAAVIGTVIGTWITNMMFNPDHEGVGVPETPHNPDEGPNGGSTGREPAPISGPPVAGGEPAP
jgi:RHS repeat-associated protein